MKKICTFILLILNSSYMVFGRYNEVKIDTMIIEFQNFFKNDRVSVIVNDYQIIENEILTSDISTGEAGVTIIFTNDTIKVEIRQVILTLPCTVALTPTVKVITILNGHKKKFNINLNKGIYIGFSRKHKWTLRLLQSEIPFIYD